MIEFIKPTYLDALRLNNILYDRYVTEDGINFKFPFDDGTLRYVELNEIDQPAIMLSNRIINAATDNQVSADDQSFITSLLANKKSMADAIIAGWIVDPATTSSGGM